MARDRNAARGRDMLLSMAVILVPVVILTLLFTRGGDEPTVETVDWRPVAQQAASEAPFELVAPVELPAGWRATRVSWTPEGEPDGSGAQSPRNRWRLGVLTDAEIYIELDQVDQLAEDFVDEASRQGVADGTSSVGGADWERLVSEDDRTRSLVLRTEKVTTLVSGDTSYQQLEAYASLLQSVD